MANKAFKPRSHLKRTEVDDGRVLVYQMQRVSVRARVLAGVLALALPRQLLYGLLCQVRPVSGMKKRRCY
eukprot:798361-Rhodomonas_salina.1